MNAPARQFEAKPAVRTRVPLLVGLAGPSGGGKTYSALRLARGMQRVTGGDVYGIDTESRRMCHYAELFTFKHVEFGAPFGPLDYLAAIEYCVKQGAKTIIVDSMSHEHEGPGGVLESHEAELDRIAGNDEGKRERCKMLAWQKPKAARRRLINTLLQIPANFIFCFRAKEKMRMGGGKPTPLGWMPIAGEEFVYEMMVNALLLPNAGGVPTWQSNEAGEKQMIKLPAQFRDYLLTRNKPLDEGVGEAMAKWALGTSAAPDKPPADKPASASMAAKILAAFADLGVSREMIEQRIGRSVDALTANEVAELRTIRDRIKAGEEIIEFFSPIQEGAK
jgi:hypothetical protein